MSRKFISTLEGVMLNQACEKKRIYSGTSSQVGKIKKKNRTSKSSGFKHQQRIFGWRSGFTYLSNKEILDKLSKIRKENERNKRRNSRNKKKIFGGSTIFTIGNHVWKNTNPSVEKPRRKK